MGQAGTQPVEVCFVIVKVRAHAQPSSAAGHDHALPPQVRSRAAGIDPGARGESLSVAQFARLAAARTIA